MSCFRIFILFLYFINLLSVFIFFYFLIYIYIFLHECRCSCIRLYTGAVWKPKDSLPSKADWEKICCCTRERNPHWFCASCFGPVFLPTKLWLDFFSLSLLLSGRDGGMQWKSGNPGSFEQDVGENESLLKVTIAVLFILLLGSPRARSDFVCATIFLCTHTHMYLWSSCVPTSDMPAMTAGTHTQKDGLSHFQKIGRAFCTGSGNHRLDMLQIVLLAVFVCVGWC